MTKIRPVHTAKHALTRALEILPISAYAEKLGISTALLYKFSDPDEDGKEISVQRALVIDALAFAAVGVAPFRDLFEDHIDDAERAQAESLKDMVLQSQASLGNLSGALVGALSPDSENGSSLSQGEMAEILSSVHKLRDLLDDISSRIMQSSQARG